MVNLKKVIRVPEKLFIQTLIVGGFTPAMVVEELQRLNLDVPTNEMSSIIDEIRNVVSDLKSFDDITLEALGLSPMYYYRFQKPAPSDISIYGCEGALKMLEDPQLRKLVTALTLAGINPIDVELLVNARYHATFESQEFQLYIKYFANFEEWGYADKAFFVDNRIKDAEFKVILRKAALKPDRAYLIWKLGLGTDPNMSMEQIFTDMLADSYFTFKENIKIRPDDAQKFAQLAIRLSDRIDSSNDKKKEVTSFAEDLHIKLVVENTQGEAKIADIKDVNIEIPRRQSQSLKLEDMKFE
jgi:hypothetical protein